MNNERLIKLILESCEDSSKETKDETKISAVTDALCKSLTNLLCYKVSVEAHQRYSVRLNLIGMLRNMCQTTGDYKYFKLFSNHEKTHTFVKTVLEKYLTDEVLKNCYSPDALNILMDPLSSYVSQDFTFTTTIEKLIDRLSRLEATRESEISLLRIFKDRQKILKLSSVEKIYVFLMDSLVVKPLIDRFSSTTDSNDDYLLQQLIQFSANSPLIFQLVARFLTEFLVHLDYSQIVIDFIQTILNSIKNNCREIKKDIIDLYPQHLQFSIILLKIEPSYHTPNSRKYTLDALRDLSIDDKFHSILLLSHFPLWLDLFFSNVDVF